MPFTSNKTIKNAAELQTLRDKSNNLEDFLTALSTLINEMKADHNALLAKLDADVGINDTNYVTLHTTSATDLPTD